MSPLFRTGLFVLFVTSCAVAADSTTRNTITTASRDVTSKPTSLSVKTTKDYIKSTSNNEPSSISTTEKILSTFPSEKTTAKPTNSHCAVGQRKPIDGSCKNYIECDKTFKWTQKSCSPMCKVFDPKLSKCVWNWQFPCMKPPTTVPEPTSTTEPTEPSSAPTQPSTTTTPKPECINGKTKIFKKGDCKNYYECDLGKWTKKTCSWGQSFDINKLECRITLWAKC